MRIFVLSLCIFIGAFIIGVPTYQQIDDVHITRILSGAYTGTPSPYVHALHIVLSAPIARLYAIYPYVSWYTIVLYTILFLSLIATFYSLTHTFKRLTALNMIPLTFVTLVYLYAIFQVQYVTIAGLCVMASLLLLLSRLHLQSINTTEIFVVIVLFFLGYFLRDQGAYLGLVVVSPALAFYAVRSKTTMRNFMAIFFVALTGGLLLFTFVQKHEYTKTAALRYATQWFHAHRSFNGYYAYYHGFYPDVYRSVGWNMNDYEMIDKWLYADTSFFKPHDISIIQSHVKTQFPASNHLSATYRAVPINAFFSGGIYLLLAYILCIWCALSIKTHKGILFVTLIAVFLVAVFFAYYVRILPYRVSVPIALYIGLLPFVLSEKIQRVPWRGHQVAATILLVLFLCAGWYVLGAEVADNGERRRRILAVLSQLPQREDALIYVGGSSIPLQWLHPFEDYRFIGTFALAGGGWPQHLLPEQELYRRYGILNIFVEAINSDKIYFLATSTQLDNYRQFMNDHYNIQVRYRVVRDFSRYEMEKSRYGYGGKLVQIISQ